MLASPKERTNLYLATCLLDCIEDKSLHQLKTLLERKDADPNMLIPQLGISPFHIVISDDSEQFSIEATKLFLSHGGDPNVKSISGKTPVHIAAALGRIDVLKLLLTNGGDPICLDDDGVSPFHCAFASQHHDAISILGQFSEERNPADDEIKYEITLEKVLIDDGNLLAEYTPDVSTVDVIPVQNEYSTGNESLEDWIRQMKSEKPTLSTVDYDSSVNDKATYSNETDDSKSVENTYDEILANLKVTLANLNLDKDGIATENNRPPEDCEVALSLQVNCSRNNARVIRDFGPKETSKDSRVSVQKQISQKEGQDLNEMQIPDVLAESRPEEVSSHNDRYVVLNKVYSWFSQSHEQPKDEADERSLNANDAENDVVQNPSVDCNLPSTSRDVIPPHSAQHNSNNSNIAAEKSNEVSSIKSACQSPSVKRPKKPTPSTDSDNYKSETEHLIPKCVENIELPNHVYDLHPAQKDIDYFEQFIKKTKEQAFTPDNANNAAQSDPENNNSEDRVTTPVSNEDDNLTLHPSTVKKKSPVNKPSASTDSDNYKSEHGSWKGKFVEGMPTELPNHFYDLHNPSIDIEYFEQFLVKPKDKKIPSAVTSDNCARRATDKSKKTNNRTPVVYDRNKNKELSTHINNQNYNNVNDNFHKGATSNERHWPINLYYKNPQVPNFRKEQRFDDYLQDFTQFVNKKNNLFECKDDLREKSERHYYVDEQYNYRDNEEEVQLRECRMCVSNRNPSDTSSYYSCSSDVWLPVTQMSDQNTPAPFLLRKRLIDQGQNPGPVTSTTYGVYLKRLIKLENQDSRNKKLPKKVIFNKDENLLSTDWLKYSKEYEALEEEMIKEFIRPNPSRKWREGNSKTSFNYLLLDPRITQGLPRRTSEMSLNEQWKTFLSSIFYVGKGKRSRPYAHLYDAFRIWTSRDNVPVTNKKISHIMDIWNEGQGVVALHVFQNIMPVEAYTREALLIETLGLDKLDNCKNGDYYGITSTWPSTKRRKLGSYLLYKAMQMLMLEGEKQLFPEHI